MAAGAAPNRAWCAALVAACALLGIASGAHAATSAEAWAAAASEAALDSLSTRRVAYLRQLAGTSMSTGGGSGGGLVTSAVASSTGSGGWPTAPRSHPRRLVSGGDTDASGLDSSDKTGSLSERGGEG